MNNSTMIKNMMLFTKTYNENSHNIFQREARCLEAQFSYLMLPVREEDLFAGRKTELPIGFWAQCCSVGYYCDHSMLQSMKDDPALTPKDLEDLNYLAEFWKGKTTYDKIFARYSPDMLTKLDHVDYNCEPGIAFPLYRMGGAQMNPEKLLNKGIVGLMQDAKKLHYKNPDFYEAIKDALKILQTVCLRYQQELKEGAHACNDEARRELLTAMADNLEHIAYYPPNTFWQAAQLSYLFFLLSGTFNYGRMDEYLGSYFAHDIDNGIITEEFALSLITSLWQLIIERNNQFDGRIILGGKDRKNVKDADCFAMAAMEVSRRCKDVLPQLTLRCYTGMDEKVYEKALEVIGEGTTFPMLYNDDVNIPAVANAFNISTEEANLYVPFGCGEYVIYNRSFGTPSGAINFLAGLNSIIYEDENLLEKCQNYEEFYQAFLSKMTDIIRQLALQEKLEYDVCAEDAPFLFFSILFDDCLALGKPVFDGGVKYLGGTLEGYGNTNTTDSLTAIKTLVYEKQLITPKELADALRNNFIGYEEVRAMLLAVPKYGNDNDIADDVAVRFHNDISKIIRNCKDEANLASYLMVVINNQMNTIFGTNTGASADGRLANTYMANANNPTGGMDKNGITALLNSLVKLRPDYHAGSVQNMRFSREMFQSMLPKTKGLLATYFMNGGTQSMITVLDRKDLENAMVEPENYQNLIVRVGGFSARFVDLSKDVQKELLSRNIY